jgi:hypothetical protein
MARVAGRVCEFQLIVASVWTAGATGIAWCSEERTPDLMRLLAQAIEECSWNEGKIPVSAVSPRPTQYVVFRHEGSCGVRVRTETGRLARHY